MNYKRLYRHFYMIKRVQGNKIDVSRYWAKKLAKKLTWEDEPVELKEIL